MIHDPRYFTSKADARDAFLTDVHYHRELIQKAFDIYGAAFCELAKANVEVVSQRVIAHDLSKINEEVEAVGLMAFYYRYPQSGLELDSPRRRYLYQKSILNHYHINSNHPEHWLKYHEGQLIAVEMDPESNVEMVLDWIAVSYEAGYESVTKYWEEVRLQKLFHENTIKLTDELIALYDRIKTSSDSEKK